jgi:cytochrome c peroxidase
MKLRILTPSILAVVLLLQSCQHDDALPTQDAYLELPATPHQYSTGDHLPTLGRVLFYDKQLSLNNSVACATCHKQAFAFADNVAFSRGFGSKVTKRNSMPIQNLATVGFEGDAIPIDGPPIVGGISLFWDGRQHDVQQMVLEPIANHIEMGVSDFDKLADKLEKTPYYNDLFNKAFGTTEVTSDRIASGLAAFITSINSNHTTLDKSALNQAGGGPGELTALQQRGQSLFVNTYNCNACHQVQSPTGYIMAGTFANIGLDEVYSDPGVAARAGGTPADAGKFKIPSLRNLSFTAPYMHDGRFNTLDQVLEHYSSGIQNNENLDVRLRDAQGVARKFNIPAGDREAIIAFLQTLNDVTVLTDPRFSNPFKTR